MRNGGYGGIPIDIDEDLEEFSELSDDESLSMMSGIFKYLDDSNSSLNKLVTHDEFLEWIKFDDSNSKDEEMMETIEIFCYEGVPI